MVLIGGNPVQFVRDWPRDRRRSASGAIAKVIELSDNQYLSVILWDS